jgi:predicted TIM-barrel fold metal-dependent hydrolase
MLESNIPFAIACGINGNGYSHEQYFKESIQIKGLVPIARFDTSVGNIEQEIQRIYEIGYRGIKIHPRFEKFDYSLEILTKIFVCCNQLGIVVHWCSFYYTKIEQYPSFDPYFLIIQALKKAPDLDLIIVHGGVHDLLRYAELARFNENILLDLSLTLFQYKETTHYQNIHFLLNKIDRRLCLGSDHPEVRLVDLRAEFEEFCDLNLPNEKLWNIACRNIGSKYSIEF